MQLPKQSAVLFYAMLHRSPLYLYLFFTPEKEGEVDAKSFHKRDPRARCAEQTTLNQCASSARSTESFVMDSSCRWLDQTTEQFKLPFQVLALFMRTKIIRVGQYENNSDSTTLHATQMRA